MALWRGLPEIAVAVDWRAGPAAVVRVDYRLKEIMQNKSQVLQG